jgi:hypothetical protein
MDETQFAQRFKSTDKFSFMSLNVQSLPAKYTELYESISFLNNNHCAPDIICLQETWKVQDSALFSLPCYHLPIIKQRNSCNGGGVGLYIKNNLQFNVLPENSVFVDRVFESIFTEVWIKDNQKIIVGSIYRPNTAHPTLSSSEQFTQFMELFSNVLNDLAGRNCKIYIFGDFNLDVLKYRSIRNVADYVDLLFSFGFLQVMLKPTRCTTHSASLIDHIVTNSNSCSHESVLLISKLSDHFPIIYFSDSNKPLRKNKFTEFRDFSDTNFLRFNEALRNVDWNDLYDFENVEHAYSVFSDRFFFFYNLYFPVQQKIINKNNTGVNPWMTKGLLVSRLHKIALCKSMHVNPTPDHVTLFKAYRNTYNKILKLSKKLYFQSQLKRYQTDLKKNLAVTT